MLTFDAKLPSRTQNDLNSAIVKDNELFTIQYIATADVIRSNHIKNQFSLYALTKLKFSKHHSYFKYLLILSGDINLHPGPVKYPCSVCAKPVRKRIISCEKCGSWIHKKCDPTVYHFISTSRVKITIYIYIYENHVKIPQYKSV